MLYKYCWKCKRDSAFSPIRFYDPNVHQCDRCKVGVFKEKEPESKTTAGELDLMRRSSLDSLKSSRVLHG